MSDQERDLAIEERYWVPSPELFEEATQRLLQTYPDRIQPYELCRNDLYEPVYGFRFGEGPRNVVLLGCVHGHEPAGTCGLVALMDGLLGGKVPGTHDVYGPSQVLLQEFSIDCIPMANPDAARRFACQVRDSYPALDFTHSQEDVERMFEIHSEPGVSLNKMRPPHYTPSEVIEWRKTGKPMGTLYTEEGVELWRDWAHGRSMQIVAIRELLRLRKPVLFVDIHNHGVANQIYVPAGLRTETDRERHEHLVQAAYDAMEREGIPFTREVVPYIQGRPDVCNSTNWAYSHLGSIQFLFEVDWGYRWPLPGVKRHKGFGAPPLSKAQIIMSVWQGMTTFLLTLVER